ncbi:hypothetical protein G9A89_005422 [Geosiphon pyriformis]|nr:hypothetical protein G9A89_005422 [Geosiphon pyriformis]
MLPKNFSWKLSFLILVALSIILSTANGSPLEYKSKRSFTPCFKACIQGYVCAKNGNCVLEKTKGYNEKCDDDSNSQPVCNMLCIIGKHCEIIDNKAECVDNTV